MLSLNNPSCFLASCMNMEAQSTFGNIENRAKPHAGGPSYSTSFSKTADLALLAQPSSATKRPSR